MFLKTVALKCVVVSLVTSCYWHHRRHWCERLRGRLCFPPAGIFPVALPRKARHRHIGQTYTSAHTRCGVSLVSFMVSHFAHKQSQHCTAEKESVLEGERLIENNEVIFKSHSFSISWFSFKSARGETRKMVFQMCSVAIYGHSGTRVKWQQCFSPEDTDETLKWLQILKSWCSFDWTSVFLSTGRHCFVRYYVRYYIWFF